MRGALQLRVGRDLSSVRAQDWDALVGDDAPFLEYAFLRGLELTGCLEPRYGWLPQPLTLWRGEELLGAIPLYLKGNSYGEFVYDWSWANLAHQLGVSYYPKMIAAVPFTPVGGARLLVRPDLSEAEREEVLDQLVAGALQWAQESGVSGLHFLFLPQWQAERLAARGFLLRHAHQYHWRNEGYADFDDFVGRFRAKRRTQILRERRGVREAGVQCEVYRGAEITPEVLGLAYGFYRKTCEQFGHWNRQYLNEAFFAHLRAQMPERLQILLARDAAGAVVAGTLTLCKGDRWYGRYWGCREEIRFLHFEACYYHPIELAISEGVQVYEPGAGGDHKYARGFTPTLTCSAHWLADARFSALVERFLAQESAAVQDEVEHMQDSSPLIHPSPRGEPEEGER